MDNQPPIATNPYRIETPQSESNEIKKNKKNYKRSFLFILIGLLLVVNLTLAIFFILNKQKYQPILDSLLCHIDQKYCIAHSLNNGDQLANQTGEIKFYILTQNISQNEIDKKENIIISDVSSFSSLWNEIHKKYTTPAPIPDVDFNHFILLGLFDGSHPTGGYEISIDKIIDQNDSITVYIKNSISSTNCLAITTPTTPYEIVKIPKTNKNIIFQPDNNPAQCPSK